MSEKSTIGKSKSKGNRSKIPFGSISPNYPTFTSRPPSRQKQNLLKIITTSMLTLLVLIFAWVIISQELKQVLGFTPVILGLCIGLVIRICTIYRSKLAGKIAAIITLAGSFTGILLCSMLLIPEVLNLNMKTITDQVSLLSLAEINLNQLNIFDFIFIGVAVFIAYLLASGFGKSQRIVLNG